MVAPKTSRDRGNECIVDRPSGGGCRTFQVLEAHLDHVQSPSEAPALHDRRQRLQAGAIVLYIRQYSKASEMLTRGCRASCTADGIAERVLSATKLVARLQSHAMLSNEPAKLTDVDPFHVRGLGHRAAS